MGKIKNWLLAALGIIGGALDLGFGILTEFAKDLDLDPKVATYVRIGILIVGGIILKLDPPSTNPEKLNKLVRKARVKKAQTL